MRVIRFSTLTGEFGNRTEKPLGDVRVHDDGILDPDPGPADIVRSWVGGVMRGVTDPKVIADKFVARYANWSNGYVVSKETENPGG